MKRNTELNKNSLQEEEKTLYSNKHKRHKGRPGAEGKTEGEQNTEIWAECEGEKEESRN